MPSIVACRRHPGISALLFFLAVLAVAWATAAPTVAARCAGGPSVTVSVTPSTGYVTATIGAPSNSVVPNNQITSIRFDDPRPSTNVTVDIVGGPQRVSGTYTLPTPASSLQMIVRPTSGAGPATANFTVVDRCGDWPTFVGGGAAAFTGPTTPPTVAPPAPTLTPTPTATPRTKNTHAVLSVNNTNFVAGDQITLVWGDVDNPAAEDWIGMYRTDDVNSNTNLLGDKTIFIGGLASGTSAVIIPDLPPDPNALFEFRLNRAKSKTLVAKSAILSAANNNPVQRGDAKALGQGAASPAGGGLALRTAPEHAVVDSAPRAMPIADAASSNDNFAAATSVGATLPAVLTASTTTNTTESGEPPSCNDQAAGYSPSIGKTAWYAFRTATGSDIVVDTVGSNFDTVLAVYSGGPSFGSLGQVACNDDTSGFLARVQFTAAPNTTYYVQAGGYGGASGNLQISFRRVSPANDAFASRRVVAGASFQDTVYTDLATNQPTEPTACDLAKTRRTVWYQLTTPNVTEVLIDTQGSDFQNVIGVYTGASLGALTPQAGKCDYAQTSPTASRVQFTSGAGVTYYVQVGGYAGVQGDQSQLANVGASGKLVITFTLGVSAPPSDSFAARPSATVPGSVSNVSNEGTGTEATEPLLPNAGTCAGDVRFGKTVWYSFMPGAGTVTIDSFGSNFDTVLAVYQGSTLGSLTPLDCNDDTNGSQAGSQSQVSFNAAAGVTYALQIGGYAGTSRTALAAATGKLVLHFNRVPNDSFGSAVFLNTMPTIFSQDTTSADLNESGEPTSFNCGAFSVTIGQTVWYRFQFGGSGSVGVQIDTLGSSFDTVLAVYTGSAVNSLSPVACNDDDSAEGVLQSFLTFNAQAGVTYYVQVGGFGSNAGHAVVTFNVRPSNDDLAAAQDICIPGSCYLPTTWFNSSTAGATTESSEVTSCSGHPFGRTVWYTFAYPINSPITVTTVGSTFDTVVSVYSGPASGATPASLSPVGCNDDANGTLLSSITFSAVAGQRYYVQIGGYAPGAPLPPRAGVAIVNFTPNPPTNDAFASAPLVSSFPATFAIYTVAATNEAGEPLSPTCTLGTSTFTSATGHTAWYRVSSSITRAVTVDTSIAPGSNFDTVVAVYSGASLGALTPVACSDDISSSDRRSLVTFQAQAGQTYYVQIGGFAGRAGSLFVQFR